MRNSSPSDATEGGIRWSWSRRSSRPAWPSRSLESNQRRDSRSEALLAWAFIPATSEVDGTGRDGWGYVDLQFTPLSSPTWLARLWRRAVRRCVEVQLRAGDVALADSITIDTIDV